MTMPATTGAEAQTRYELKTRRIFDTRAADERPVISLGRTP
jgi:hypothetical protein